MKRRTLECKKLRYLVQFVLEHLKAILKIKKLNTILDEYVVDAMIGKTIRSKMKIDLRMLVDLDMMVLMSDI